MGYEGKALTLAAIIAVLNYLSGGYVMEQIGQTMSGPQGQYLTDNGKCMISLMFLPPLKTIDIFGFVLVIPLPSFDDLLVAFFMGLLIIWILHTLLHWELSFWRKLLVIGMVWFVLKLVMLWLMISSPGCVDLMSKEHEIFEPMHWVGVVLAPLVLFRWIKGKVW